MLRRAPFCLSLWIIGTAIRLTLACELSVDEFGGGASLHLNGGPAFRVTTTNVSGLQCLELPGSETIVALWSEQLPGESSVPYYGISLDGVNMARVTRTSYRLELKNAQFDPVDGAPAVDPLVQWDDDVHLHLVQFQTQPLAEYRTALLSLGANIRSYLPSHTFLVEMSEAVSTQVAALPFVRWVGPLHPAYKLEPFLLQNISLREALFPSQRYYVQLVNDTPELKTAVAARIAQAGGTIDALPSASLLVQATLTPEQLLEVIRWDQVLYVERWSEPTFGMDNARSVGGANAVEIVGGYTGQGVRGAVVDSALVPHPEFTPAPIFLLDENVGGPHGTNVYGCLFSDGSGDPRARGMLPDAIGIFGDNLRFANEREAYTCRLVSSDCNVPMCVVSDETPPPCPFHAVFLNNSWTSGGITPLYNTQAQAADRSVYLHDLLVCQCQGNAGDPANPSDIKSFQEAWGKNVVSVGGIRHRDTPCRNDDVWDDGVIGISSHGPTLDGRIKPDLVQFNDKVWTTNADTPTGPYGYFDFHGTSAASPIVAGHFGIFFQMWSEGTFGNNPPNPPEMVFENRPHAATAKAMLINTARPYAFAADINRGNSGWGWPDLQKLYDLRNRFPVLIDETVILENLEQYATTVTVESGVPAMRITLAYTDPAAEPMADPARINDLTLRAVSPSGSKFVGNWGLMQGQWSIPNGEENTIDNVENIFISNPEPGDWLITVRAEEINPEPIYDGHPETPEPDADFALVVSLEHSDCNGNGVADFTDIASLASADTDFNGVPDECETSFVDAAAAGAGDGSSWVNAFTDLRAALEAASVVDPCGFRTSKVWIAEGTYKPAPPNGDRGASFVIPDSVTIFGGFPSGGGDFADRDPVLHPTVLSGDLNGNDLGFMNNAENAYHVVMSAPSASRIGLNGVIVTAGNANGAGFESRGGGVFSTTAAITMINCGVVGNHSATMGGGLYDDGNVALINTVFAGNEAGTLGGGVLCFGGSKSLTNCVFTGNSASKGGGFYTAATATVTNCTFSHNVALVTGGGMYHQDGASDVHNSIFWANSDAGGTTSAAQIYEATGTVTASYSDIQGSWPGATNINVDPLFVDFDGPDNLVGTLDDNLRLTGTSPAIDAGDNTAVPDDAYDLDGDTIASEATPEDIAGRLRFADAPTRPDTGNGLSPIVDMGAYEYQGSTVECVLADTQVCTCESYVGGVCVHTEVEFGNVNCSVNQSPNLDDILCVLSGFGNFASCPNSDIVPPCAGNNIINLDDILNVLSAFGGADPCGCNP